MASKVLVPAAPFAKLQLKKSPPESTGGFIISEASDRVAHLEHSVRFLQEQHRLMLSGLHAEIEALRERNRDLQFQLIFNKESAPKTTAADDAESNEESLRKEVNRLEKAAGAARGEARAAGARALQLQELVDAQAEKLRELELRQAPLPPAAGGGPGEEESRAELRVRLAEAERLVRRLRADAERQRRELQCMKNSLHASLRASGLDAYGYQNTYAFPPPLHADFWREPLREEYSMGSRNRNNRRPLTLPELNAVGHPLRATVYANHHTRVRGYGYEKTKKSQPPNGETTSGKSSEEPTPSEETCLKYVKTDSFTKCKTSDSLSTYPELKVVVTKIIPHGNVSAGEARSRRRAHRKHSDQT